MVIKQFVPPAPPPARTRNRSSAAGEAPALRTAQRILIVLMLFASSISCSSSTVKPEVISSSDMCEFCRMAISQKQFASEIILQDGSVRKFDDIGCMLNFRPALKGQQVAACFVVDYATREWLRADNAFYVRSQQVATPMSGGLIAFRDSSQAGQAAARYGGKVLKWSQLWI